MYEVGLVAKAVQTGKNRGHISEPMTDDQRALLMSVIDEMRPLYLKAIADFIDATGYDDGIQ